MKFSFTLKQVFLALMVFGATTMFAQTPFYTEDFTNGQGAWTINTVVGDGTATADWQVTTAGGAGGYGLPAISSTSGGNFLLFDSDANCSASGAQDARIYSGAINCSSYGNVTMSFESSYRRFNDSVYVMVSTDATTWTYFPVHAGFTNNQTSADPELVTVDISSIAAGQATVYIGFRFLSDGTTILAGTLTGCAYNWMVDDIQLVDGGALVNTAISLKATPRSYKTPLLQADSIYFAATVSNTGTADASNVALEVSVTDLGNSSVVFSDTVTIDTLTIGYVDSFFDFNTYFLPTAIGVYQVDYTLSQDATDFDPSDNSFSFLFEITGDEFANDNGVAAATYTPGGTAGGQGGVGNAYYFSTADTVTLTASFGINNPADLANEDIAITLYELDANGDGSIDENLDGTFDFQDLITSIVALANYTVTGAEPTTDYTSVMLDNFNNPSQPIEIKAEKEYLLFAEYGGTLGCRFLLSQPVEYDFYINNNNAFFPRNTVVYGPNSSGQLQMFTGGFTSGAQAMVKLGITQFNNTQKEIELSTEAVKVFPNPATDYINVELNLENVSNASINIIDMNGRIISTQLVENVTTATRTIDVSKFAAGTYMVRVLTEEGAKTSRFVVTH